MTPFPKWTSVLALIVSLSSVAEGPAVAAWFNAHGVSGQVGLVFVVAICGAAKILSHSLTGDGGK